MFSAVFNIRTRSLVRGTALVLISLGAALLFSGFPQVHTAWPIMFAAFAALWGMVETSRCLRLRWSFYHGGVVVLL
ncbi:MAG TPA: permease, partial [Acidobacteriaceae bacterium]|nr:permease [Acidobacteriaceae bacterium]